MQKHSGYFRMICYLQKKYKILDLDLILSKMMILTKIITCMNKNLKQKASLYNF